MPPPLRENLLEVLDACRRFGVFHPRIDASSLTLDRERIDEALDHLRTGGFLEIADWVADKGQGYRLTAAGQAALADPRRLTRPAAPVEAPAVQRSIRSGDDRWTAVIDSVVRPKPAIVTPILIAINIAVFIWNAVEVGRHKPVGMFLQGALVPDFGVLVTERIVRHGEWWRLITYMFLHAGLLHIGCNMYSLYSLGNVMEGRLGWWRYLILYFGSGILAGVAVMVFAPSVPVLGASGAICGVLTSLAAWAWLLRRYLPREFVQAHVRIVGINLFILVIIGSSMNVSNTCHAGGAVAGAILTIPLLLLDRAATTPQRILGAVLLAAIAAATWGVVVFRVIPSLS
jgi:membrane associated rhomboid family serine protease